MTRYILRRLLRAVLTVFVTLTVFFVLLRLNVDIGALALDLNASQEAIDAFNARWNYDGTIWEQYVSFVKGLLDGDFGYSFRDSRPATDWVLERLPKTLLLSGTGFLGMTVIGITAGIVAAMNRGGRIDRTLMSLAVAGYSMPSFVFSLVVMYVFAVWLQMLPSSGSTTWSHLVLPASVYALTGAAGVARFTRSAMLDVLGQPYIRAAAAAGSPRTEVITRHAAPNAAIPVVTMLGFSAGQLIGHAVIVETVFAWPGLGQALVTAVAFRDLAVVQVIIVLFVTFMVTANFIVDLLYGVLNPKIRMAGHGAHG